MSNKFFFPLILLFSLILRLVYINQSFWLDEAISAITANKPFPYQITGLGGDFQPPLHYLILKVVSLAGIHSEWIYRLPSIIAGAGTVYFLYLLALRFFDKRTALISALIASTSQFQNYYSQEARMYSLLCFLSVLFMWSYYNNKKIIYVLSAVFGIYTNYMFFFILPVPLFIIIFLDKNRIKLYQYLSATLLILLSFLPWIPVFSKQLVSSAKMISDLPLWSSLSSVGPVNLLIQLFIKFTIGRLIIQNKIIYLLLIIPVAVIYSYIIITGLKKLKLTQTLKNISVWLFLPLLLSLIFSLFKPVANYWRLIFLQIPFILIVSLLISGSRRYKILLAAVILINMASIIYYWSGPHSRREDWRGVVEFLDSQKSPVIFNTEGGFDPYLWYSSRQSKICGPATVKSCLYDRKVYYVSYLKDLYGSEDNIKLQLLKEGYALRDTFNYSGVGLIYVYENIN